MFSNDLVDGYLAYLKEICSIKDVKPVNDMEDYNILPDFFEILKACADKKRYQSKGIFKEDIYGLIILRQTGSVYIYTNYDKKIHTNLNEAELGLNDIDNVIDKKIISINTLNNQIIKEGSYNYFNRFAASNMNFHIDVFCGNRDCYGYYYQSNNYDWNFWFGYYFNNGFYLCIESKYLLDTPTKNLFLEKLSTNTKLLPNYINYMGIEKDGKNSIYWYRYTGNKDNIPRTILSEFIKSTNLNNYI